MELDDILAQESDTAEFGSGSWNGPERVSWAEGVRARGPGRAPDACPGGRTRSHPSTGHPQEPVTQRDRGDSARVSWPLLAVLLIAFGSSGPDYLPTRNHLPLVEPKHGPEAETAAGMLEQGQPKEAAAYLRSKGSKLKKEPYATAGTRACPCGCATKLGSPPGVRTSDRDRAEFVEGQIAPNEPRPNAGQDGSPRDRWRTGSARNARTGGRRR